MSIYSDVTKENLIDLRKLPEQKASNRAEKIKNIILKQKHDVKLAKSLSPITKKLDKVNKFTKKLGDVIKKSNCENENNQEIVPVEIESDNSEGDNTKPNIRTLPNSSIFSDLLTKTLGRLMCRANSLRIKSSRSGASILGVPLNTMGGDRIQMNDIIYDITREVHKALSSTTYNGKTMKIENDILTMNNMINDLGYTVIGDKKSNRKTFFTTTLPKLVEESQTKTFDEFTDDSHDLQGQRLKTITPSNIIEIYTRLEILLGLKLSGQSKTLTETSNLINELYKRDEIRNK